MSTMSENDMALDWDADLVAPDEHSNAILPEGYYNYEVVDFVRGRFPGSEKLCACPQAEVTLWVSRNGNPLSPNAYIKERFPLNSKMMWKLVPFLKSVGLVDSELSEGEKFTVEWENLPQSYGKCYVEPGSFIGSDGNEVQVNRITCYLTKEEASHKRIY